MTHFNRFPLVSLLALGIAMPAMAQTPAATSGPQTAPQQAPQDEERDRGDVVVVTAQKREETVQDIAVAVTAITSELRDQIGLTTVQDYTNFAPGLAYSTANDRLGMRGVTRTSNNFGIRSGISNYVDGVYFSSAIPASREPIFVERVEVVRGPQGTLYGRDSIGGALNVITKRPTDDFEGQFNIGFGNFQNYKVETTMAGPINDWLRYRVGATRSAQNDGYFTNASGLEPEGGRKDDTYVEGQLEGDIGDRFEWWIRAGRLTWDVRKGAPGARTGTDVFQPYDTRFFGSTADIGPNAWYGLTDPNRVQVGSQNTNPTITDRNKFNTDFTNYAKLSPTSELALEGIWHADGFDIKYLGGYVWYNYLLRQDQDGTPIKRFTCGSPACGGSGRVLETERISDYVENRGWYSNEINFLSTWDGPLQLIAGLYQYQENYNQLVFVSNVVAPPGPVTNLAGAPVPVLPPHTGYGPSSGAPSGASLLFFTNNAAINNAYGAFVQSEWQINDQFKFAAGIRYSKDLLKGREYARVINHYVIQTLVPVLPPRIDVTSTLGGFDPTTGQPGEGVLNATGPTGTGQARFGIYTDPVTGNAYRDMSAEFEEVTGELRLDWTPDSDTLIYGKYNRGYKPGGLGCAAVFCVMVPTPFTDKELIDAFEVGFKREWPEWNLTTNVEAFYYDYQGYQISNTIVPDDPDGAGPLPRPAAYAAYVNLPKTETTGFELETIWRPIDNLRILFNYGWLNPEIKESPSLVHSLDPFALDPAAQPLGAPVACVPGPPACHGVQGQSLAGNILPFSPKNKIGLNGTYTWNFEDGSNIDASLSYFWQDISFSSVFNRSYTKIPSWDQTDGRISWTNKEGNLTLIGFVRNMFDEIVYDSKGAGFRESISTSTATPVLPTDATRYTAPTQCFTTPQNSPGLGVGNNQSCYTTFEGLRPPRTWGAELQIRF